MTSITQEQLAHFKTALLKEKAQIESDRVSYVNDARGDTEDQSASELADYDPNDPADEATNLFDRERNSAEVDNMNRILSKIDRALAKIEEGTYGLSEINGAPIPIERLKALPYALTTIEQEDSL